jgi:hypothetical protein
LISPEFRFKDLRRHNCKVNLERLDQSTILYLADGHPPEQVTIDNLIKNDYLDAALVDLTNDSDDQSARRYRFDPVTEIWSHSLYGRLGAFTPLIDIEVTHVREVERSMYEQFRWQYQRYFRQYLDPVGIGVSLGENTITFHTVVLPLIDDPIYTSTISYIGREGDIDATSYIMSSIPSDYGISLLVRSPSLKEILSKRHWVWRPYNYFYREMQEFLDDADIFGSELFLGIGDFGFGQPYTTFQKPYPETLKEWSSLSSELPVVMIQSLEDDQQGQEYVRRLFHQAHQSTIQETPVYAFPLLGNIHLYGSVKHKLLTITSSLERQRDVLTRQASTPEQSSEFYHLTATLQPDYLQQFKPHLFQLIQRQMHMSCKRSLATVQNLLDLYIARYGSPPADGDLRELLVLGKITNLPRCPQNGTFSIHDETVVCSVHGSLETYHEPEQISDDFFLNPVFDNLKRLVTQLKFTEEGIVSKVEIVLNNGSIPSPK